MRSIWILEHWILRNRECFVTEWQKIVLPCQNNIDSNLSWMDFSRPVIIFNFLKVTRNFKVYMRRNLRFWKFPIWTPESRILFHSADLYEIFLNMHHLVTTMPKISFPTPFSVWKVKMFRPMPSKRKDARTGGHALWNQYVIAVYIAN